MREAGSRSAPCRDCDGYCPCEQHLCGVRVAQGHDCAWLRPVLAVWPECARMGSNQLAAIGDDASSQNQPQAALVTDPAVTGMAAWCFRAKGCATASSRGEHAPNLTGRI